MIPLLDNSIKMMIPWVPKTTLIDSAEKKKTPHKQNGHTFLVLFGCRLKKLKRETCGLPAQKAIMTH